MYLSPIFCPHVFGKRSPCIADYTECDIEGTAGRVEGWGERGEVTAKKHTKFGNHQFDA